MNVHGKHYRTIWLKEDDPRVVQIIDQSILPFKFEILDLTTVDQVAHAIKAMLVRGAGLIGATAGYGMYIAALNAPRDSREVFLVSLRAAGEQLKATRPTAINLAWAVERTLAAVEGVQDIEAMIDLALHTATAIADEDADYCRRIGEHGVSLIEEISQRKGGKPVNVLTHCNAGWLAFVDYGTATAPIYAAHDKGIPVHVWVDETRPRNQGARLTAWELGQHGVPFDIIADNVGGHLMQHGLVDLVITGTDRTTYTGDVANKIGTYLKALAANDNGVPFYVALPSSTFDWETRDGVHGTPIEERDATEVIYMDGVHDGEVVTVRITPEGATAKNYGFDVTPARLVTGLITERGICAATEEGVLGLYPEKRK
ncbi:S-methyl-5-thioribose-1-phosphate isomerase [Aggregatilinea lenta]|uniref:S-methyl-5-thioribose-1-phosphate isomerase n=1 Tax=Aggregatilinea lenta TaxID=913108 RepID=UPI000E5A25B0|nr:S-methyl-5-thioribose-1-phosphate isomerase [Aggregatilinea lenta]